MVTKRSIKNYEHKDLFHLFGEVIARFSLEELL